MILYIFRGLPGTGKSTKAKSLGCFHIENDMMKTCDGEYLHKKNPHDVKVVVPFLVDYMLAKHVDVVVSNVFHTKASIEPYLEIAKKHGATVKIHTFKMVYGNVHNVPNVAVYGFKKGWEDIDGEIMNEEANVQAVSNQIP